MSNYSQTLLSLQETRKKKKKKKRTHTSDAVVRFFFKKTELSLLDIEFFITELMA